MPMASPGVGTALHVFGEMFKMMRADGPSGGNLHADHALSGARHDGGRGTMEDRLPRLCPDR